MSKLHLIHEIETAVKMATGADYDTNKLTRYLDDLLCNYDVAAKEELFAGDNNLDYIHKYITARQIEHYAPGTLQNARYELNRFANFIQKPLVKATTADIRAYLGAHGDLMQSTLNSKMERLSAFYGWLVLEEEILKNPVAKIKRSKVPSKVRDGLTIIELEKVRAACVKSTYKGLKKKADVDIRKRALVEVLYSTACRLDELYKLNRNDLDWNTSSVIVFGKGSKERRVFLSEKAKYYLEQYLDSRDDDCPALFVTERTPVRRLTKAGIGYQVEQIKTAAGIERSLHPHIFRHTFAQISLNAGMPLEDLQAYLGHEDPGTTLRYAQVAEERKRAAFNRYHQQ